MFFFFSPLWYQQSKFPIVQENQKQPISFPNIIWQFKTFYTHTIQGG